MSFASLLPVYLEDLRLRRCSASTRTNALQALPPFFDHLKSLRVRDVRKVGEAHLVSFLRHLATRERRAGGPLAVSTQAQYFAVVKAFFGFLERRNVLLQNPAAGVPLPVRRRLPRAISEAQVRRLVSAPENWTTLGRRNRALLELLYGTGLRMTECVRLDLMDVDLLFVGAHPDDDMGVLATFARYLRDEGFKGTVITLTGGEGGGNATGPETGRALGLIREEEERRPADRAGEDRSPRCAFIPSRERLREERRDAPSREGAAAQVLAEEDRDPAERAREDEPPAGRAPPAIPAVKG